MKLPHAFDVHSNMLSDLNDQGLVWQGDAPVSESNRHHRGGDQGAKVDGGLSQESVKTAGSLNGDHGVAHDRVQPIGQNVVDAPDIIAKVNMLKTSLSLRLHLMRAPLHKTLHYISTGGKMIYWPRVDQATYKWHSRDVANESWSHLNNFPPDPSQKGIATPLMQVGVKLSYYLLYCGTVISYHLCPSLGIQDCLYPRCVVLKVWHDQSLLDNNPMVPVIEVITT